MLNIRCSSYFQIFNTTFKSFWKHIFIYDKLIPPVLALGLSEERQDHKQKVKIIWAQKEDQPKIIGGLYEVPNLVRYFELRDNPNRGTYSLV